MSFRRSKAVALEADRWRAFLNQNRSLLEESTLPQHLFERQELFDDFLMHGCLSHHPRPYDFSVEDLDRSQELILREIVIRYLADGFGDPGLALFDSDSHEEMRAEARRRTAEA